MGYGNAAVAVGIPDQPNRPGGVSDSKSALTHRIQSLFDATGGLTQALERGGFLRADVPTPASTGQQAKSPSVDSQLSQHLAELAGRVSAITSQIESLTGRLDV